MQSQFTMFWNDANVKGVTLWGYIEGATWETNTGLMTSSGTMRPAMTWLVDFLKRIERPFSRREADRHVIDVDLLMLEARDRWRSCPRTTAPSRCCPSRGR